MAMEIDATASSSCACEIPAHRDGWLKRRWIEIGLVVLYSAMIVWLASRHEVWRDEMRALSLVLESHSPQDFFHLLSAEGHPCLWYLILDLFYFFLHHAVALKCASLTIAIGAAVLFVFTSPFSLPLKALFLLGYYPIYEYSVMARNYGVSMLLLFGFCSLYSGRRKNFLWISLIVFLLAQSNVHSLLIAAAIFLSLLVEFVYRRVAHQGETPAWPLALAGFGIMALGLAGSLAQIYPDPTSVVSQSALHLTWKTLLKAGLTTWLHPGGSFPDAFGWKNPWFASVVIWLALVYFLRRPFILLILVLGIGGLGAIFSQIYGGAPRHQGFAYLLIVCAFWMERMEYFRPSPEAATRWLPWLGRIFLYLLLILQVGGAVQPVRNDISQPFSSSRAFGDAIRREARLHDALILGDPDFFLESVSYYVSNPIYLAREKRFGRTVRFTTATQLNLTLQALLETAQKLKAEYRRPVLILLSHPLNPAGPYLRKFSYGESFEFTAPSLAAWDQATRKTFEFRGALTDETYVVYELK